MNGNGPARFTSTVRASEASHAVPCNRTLDTALQVRIRMRHLTRKSLSLRYYVLRLTHKVLSLKHGMSRLTHKV